MLTCREHRTWREIQRRLSVDDPGFARSFRAFAVPTMTTVPQRPVDEGGEMYCYDCSRRGRPETAIGVCAACGAGVCANCARVGRQTIRRMEGFVPSEHSNIETRIVNCGPCADAVHIHHPVEQGLARQGSQ